MKTLKIAIFLLLIMGLIILFIPARTITVSNARFIEMLKDNKIDTVQFISGNKEVIGYPPNNNAPLIYTYTDTTNSFDHPPKLYDMLKKNNNKVIILWDYAPVDKKNKH